MERNDDLKKVVLVGTGLVLSLIHILLTKVIKNYLMEVV